MTDFFDQYEKIIKKDKKKSPLPWMQSHDNIGLKENSIEQPSKVDQHSIEHPSKVDQHLIEQPSKVDQHLIEQPSKVDQHSIEHPSKADQHLIEQPSKVDQHLIEQPSKVDQHSIEHPSKADQHLIEQPSKVDQHLIEQPSKVDQHSIEQPSKVDQHLIEHPSKADQHLIEHPSKADSDFIGSSAHNVEALEALTWLIEDLPESERKIIAVLYKYSKGKKNSPRLQVKKMVRDVQMKQSTISTSIANICKKGLGKKLDLSKAGFKGFIFQFNRKALTILKKMDI